MRPASERQKRYILDLAGDAGVNTRQVDSTWEKAGITEGERGGAVDDYVAGLDTRRASSIIRNLKREAGGPTTRERREARAERRREWAEGREAKAGELEKRNERLRGDNAFFTQPGRIVERDRYFDRQRRAGEHQAKAGQHEQAAAGLERQLERSIYDDDPDVVERLTARIEARQAEVQRVKAANARLRAWAKERKGQVPTLKELVELGYTPSEAHGALLTARPDLDPSERPTLRAPGWALSNLNANLRRDKKRLEDAVKSASVDSAHTAPPDGQSGPPAPTAPAAPAAMDTPPARAWADYLAAQRDVQALDADRVLFSIVPVTFATRTGGSAVTLDDEAQAAPGVCVTVRAGTAPGTLGPVSIPSYRGILQRKRPDGTWEAARLREDDSRYFMRLKSGEELRQSDARPADVAELDRLARSYGWQGWEEAAQGALDSIPEALTGAHARAIEEHIFQVHDQDQETLLAGIRAAGFDTRRQAEESYREAHGHAPESGQELGTWASLSPESRQRVADSVAQHRARNPEYVSVEDLAAELGISEAAIRRSAVGYVHANDAVLASDVDEVKRLLPPGETAGGNPPVPLAGQQENLGDAFGTNRSLEMPVTSPDFGETTPPLATPPVKPDPSQTTLAEAAEEQEGTPEPEPAKPRRQVTPAAEAARAIRQELKAAGLTVDSVRSENFSGGDAVDIRLTDAPPEALERVEEIAARHRGGYFDGMTDTYVGQRDPDTPQAKYVMAENRMTPQMQQEIWAYARQQFPDLKGAPAAIEEARDRTYGNDLAATWVHRLFSGTLPGYWESKDQPRAETAAPNAEPPTEKGSHANLFKTPPPNAEPPDVPPPPSTGPDAGASPDSPTCVECGCQVVVPGGVVNKPIDGMCGHCAREKGAREERASGRPGRWRNALGVQPPDTSGQKDQEETGPNAPQEEAPPGPPTPKQRLRAKQTPSVTAQAAPESVPVPKGAGASGKTGRRKAMYVNWNRKRGGFLVGG